MATTFSTLDNDICFDADKLTYEIFSILENNFLFGNTNTKQQQQKIDMQDDIVKFNSGKVRILSIDGSGATDGVLAANSLAHLESSLRRKSGNPNAVISDFFDVVAGSGIGGVLAALLFTKGPDNRSVFTADQALEFMIDNRKKIFQKKGLFGKLIKKSGTVTEKLLKNTFGEITLKDTLKSVLIPCYDLNTKAPFVFSRADALEMDGFDFMIKDVCLATLGGNGAAVIKSVDKGTKIVAFDGGIATNNPTATAITHVLNNKQEFPFCNGVEDLLVVSLGNGESDFGAYKKSTQTRVAADGSSDTVDQAVSMAFGQCRESNYVRIQASGFMSKSYGDLKHTLKSNKKMDILLMTEDMLAQKNVESVLFRGKKMVGSTNLDKLEMFAGELIKEQERRKTSILPTVLLKQTSYSPRTSSATSLSTISSC